MANHDVDFLARGLAGYLDVRQATSHFMASLQEIAKNALTERLPTLLSAIGEPVVAKDLYPSSQADDEEFTWAWVAIMRPCEPPLSQLYAGIGWETGDNGTTNAYAMSFFVAANASARDHLLTGAQSVRPPARFKLENTWRNEVQMRADLTPQDAPQLNRFLQDILSEWERVFRAIGGAAALNRRS